MWPDFFPASNGISPKSKEYQWVEKKFSTLYWKLRHWHGQVARLLHAGEADFDLTLNPAFPSRLSLLQARPTNDQF
jgi:hypothetical protein